MRAGAPGLKRQQRVAVAGQRVHARVREWNFGWLYWLPNPLLPFIWYRLVLPVGHPDLLVEEREATPAG